MITQPQSCQTKKNPPVRVHPKNSKMKLLQLRESVRSSSHMKSLKLKTLLMKVTMIARFSFGLKWSWKTAKIFWTRVSTTSQVLNPCQCWMIVKQWETKLKGRLTCTVISSLTRGTLRCNRLWTNQLFQSKSPKTRTRTRTRATRACHLCLRWR